MKKEKTKITQELCRKVQIMLAGAKMGEVAALLGISKTTVSRIKAAEFDPEQYAKNTQKRVEEENKVTADPEPEQVEGQMEMDLQPAEVQEEYVDLQIRVPKYGSMAIANEQKLIRFLAGKFGDTNVAMTACVADLIAHMVRIEDYVAQILRKMDG